VSFGELARVRACRGEHFLIEAIGLEVVLCAFFMIAACAIDALIGAELRLYPREVFGARHDGETVALNIACIAGCHALIG